MKDTSEQPEAVTPSLRVCSSIGVCVYLRASGPEPSLSRGVWQKSEQRAHPVTCRVEIRPIPSQVFSAGVKCLLRRFLRGGGSTLQVCLPCRNTWNPLRVCFTPLLTLGKLGRISLPVLFSTTLLVFLLHTMADFKSWNNYVTLFLSCFAALPKLCVGSFLQNSLACLRMLLYGSIYPIFNVQ